MIEASSQPTNPLSAPPYSRRRRLLRGSILLIGLGVSIGLAFLLSPWFQLQRGGHYLTAGNGEQAAVQFREAVARMPDSVFAWRQLARAELLRGDPPAAVIALQQAAALAPDDPLVGFELALAYEAGNDLRAADATWQQLDLPAFVQLGYASRAFAAEHYAEAATWFTRAVRAGASLDPTHQFQAGLAAIMTGTAIPEAGDASDRIEIEPAGRVEGARFRWITAHPRYNVASGDLLTAEAGKTNGILFWNGAAAVVVEAEQTGRSFLRLRARQSQPAPVLLAVAVNDQPAARIALERGTGESTTLTWLVDVEAGPQAVIISFLNDGVVDGIDRNAVIEWVELIPAD